MCTSKDVEPTHRISGTASRRHRGSESANPDSLVFDRFSRPQACKRQLVQKNFCNALCGAADDASNAQAQFLARSMPPLTLVDAVVDDKKVLVSSNVFESLKNRAPLQSIGADAAVDARECANVASMRIESVRHTHFLKRQAVFFVVL